VIHEIHDSKGCTFLSEELPDIDSFNDNHPYFDDDPLSSSTTFSANSLLEEFADELALISYPPDYDDNRACHIESDIREIEFLIYQVKDSNFKDSIDQSDLANHDDLFVDPTPEMFTDEQPPDYLFPLRFDVYPDDFLKIESDATFDDDSFDSEGEKIIEDELLIDQLDLPYDILSEYDSFNSQDFSRDDVLPSLDNEDKVFNPGILIHDKSVNIITRVTQEKKLAVSYASLLFEDFDPPFYELLVFKEEMDSIIKDSVFEDNIADTMLEMFTDEHALDYSSPPLYDEYDKDLFEVESDTEYVYPFDSKGEKIKESKLLIDELDLSRSSDFLPSPETFLKSILVLPDKNVKKIAISHASLILEDFDPPIYELPFLKKVPRELKVLSACLVSARRWNQYSILAVVPLKIKGEIKKLEIELWNLKVKGNDVGSYTQRFQELALICTKFVSDENEKVDKYISGLPDNIHGNVMSARPKTLDEAIELANDLMDQKLRTYTERQTQTYAVRIGERKEYAGTFPLCNKCKFHHNGPCTTKCVNCKKVGHLTRDFWKPTATSNQKTTTCYECGNQRHYKSDCPELKNRNHGNQAEGTGARGMVYALRGGETNQDLDDIKDDINA
nr:hypothetical protein [Tanacetum cinerariifolium]